MDVSIWLFVLVTYAASWLLWGVCIVAGWPSTGFPGMLLHVVGGFAPSVVAIVLVAARASREARRDFWRRALDARRVRPLWWALALLLTPAAMLVAVLIDSALGGGAPDFSPLQALLAQPASLPIMVIMLFVAGPLSEELGWRGLALEHLQRTRSPLVASLIIAPVWWAWHLPLFLLVGTTQYKWGLTSPMVWVFALVVLVLSFLHTLAYNRNGRSTLAAILVHFSFGLSLSLVGLSVRVWVLLTALLVVATALLWWLDRPARQAR
jgi:uncharacterized protein